MHTERSIHCRTIKVTRVLPLNALASVTHIKRMCCLYFIFSRIRCKILMQIVLIWTESHHDTLYIYGIKQFNIFSYNVIFTGHCTYVRVSPTPTHRAGGTTFSGHSTLLCRKVSYIICTVVSYHIYTTIV